MKEIDLAGIYIAPFAAYLIVTVIIFVPLHKIFDRLEVHRWVWHRSLFDLSIFVIILSLIGLSF